MDDLIRVRSAKQFALGEIQNSERDSWGERERTKGIGLRKGDGKREEKRSHRGKGWRGGETMGARRSFVPRRVVKGSSGKKRTTTAG